MGYPARQSWSKPQLRRFVHHDKPIKVVKLLGGGTEALVFLIEVERKEYTMKLVCTTRRDETRRDENDLLCLIE